MLTDADNSHRLVAKGLNSSKTEVSAIMTPNPTWVSTSDSAMNVLGIVVQKCFCHLPILDERGAIAGLLDIAKCLNGALSKLECTGPQGELNAENAIKEVLDIQGSAGSQVTALTMLLCSLLLQAFEGTLAPTSQSLLVVMPKTLVSSSSKLCGVAMLMAESRIAALAVDNRALTSIFGFKDVMTRAVAREPAIDKTNVSGVMTPNLEFTPKLTLVIALQICTIKSNSCTSKQVFEAQTSTKPVAKLRPAESIIIAHKASVLDVCQLLANICGAASSITEETHGIFGIINDHDII